MATPIEEIHKLFEQLSPDRQRRVLEYAQILAQTDRLATFPPTTPLPPGTPGRALLRFKLPLFAGLKRADPLTQTGCKDSKAD